MRNIGITGGGPDQGPSHFPKPGEILPPTTPPKPTPTSPEHPPLQAAFGPEETPRPDVDINGNPVDSDVYDESQVWISTDFSLDGGGNKNSGRKGGTDRRVRINIEREEDRKRDKYGKVPGDYEAYGGHANTEFNLGDGDDSRPDSPMPIEPGNEGDDSRPDSPMPVDPGFERRRRERRGWGWSAEAGDPNEEPQGNPEDFYEEIYELPDPSTWEFGDKGSGGHGQRRPKKGPIKWWRREKREKEEEWADEELEEYGFGDPEPISDVAKRFWRNTVKRAKQNGYDVPDWVDEDMDKSTPPQQNAGDPNENWGQHQQDTYVPGATQQDDDEYRMLIPDWLNDEIENEEEEEWWYPDIEDKRDVPMKRRSQMLGGKPLDETHRDLNLEFWRRKIKDQRQDAGDPPTYDEFIEGFIKDEIIDNPLPEPRIDTRGDKPNGPYNPGPQDTPTGGTERKRRGEFNPAVINIETGSTRYIEI